MILDLKMPGIDGIEVLQTGQANPAGDRGDHPHRARLGGQTAETCMQLGAFAYLHKPVDIEVLSRDAQGRECAYTQQSAGERTTTCRRPAHRAGIRTYARPAVPGTAFRMKPCSERHDSRTFWNERFTDTDTDAGPFRRLFNYRRIWRLAVLLTACVAILPLFVLAILDLNVTRHSAETEINLRISKLVSNTDRTLTFFLEERRYALDFIVRSHSYAELADRRHLAGILKSLKEAMGGFTDLGVIRAHR
ncbi:MAG: hypothetical protein MZV65_17930 [Chromatiales bacterium]|nr:hypothetical protein [Chromatiales bacterium]